MIGVHEHLAAVLGALGPIDPIDVALSDAVGCILAEDLISDVDVPGRPSAAWDGYAVLAANTHAVSGTPSRGPDGHNAAASGEAEADQSAAAPAAGQGDVGGVTLTVTAVVGAGKEAPSLVDGCAVRVASGAMLPERADAVVSTRATDGGEATVHIPHGVDAGTGVWGVGCDVPAGKVLVAAGTRLGARQLALAAGMGRGRLQVHPKPRVVILSVGDELVNPGSPTVPAGSRFDANVHALTTAIADAGGIPLRVGVVADDRAVLRDIIEDQLVRADLMITTGGLSESEFDTVKDVLSALGTVAFEDVAMAPGSRHGFGTVGEGVPIFALPGHPVAAQVAYEIFVRPALRRIGGHVEVFRPSVRAVAQEAFGGVAGKRSFVPVEVLGHPELGYTLTVLGDSQFPGLSDLARANAFAVVPEQVGHVERGTAVTCMVLEG